MKAPSIVHLLTLGCLALSSCDSRNRMSGTVQRVSFSNGLVLLELSDKEMLAAEPASLIDNAEAVAGLASDRPLESILEAIQEWKGRRVEFTGEVKVVEGRRWGVIKRDRSNLSLR